MGDRVAQLVLERIYTPEVREVESLDETARGAPPGQPIARPCTGSMAAGCPSPLGVRS